MTTNNDKVPIPRKLNQGMITALCDVIRKGNYHVVACQLCGINEATLYDWINQAEKDWYAGRETIYTSLVKSLKEAEAEAEAEMVAVVRSKATESKEWLPAMVFLERRHPDRWGRRERKSVEITERRLIEITHVEVIKDTGEQRVIEAEKVKLLNSKEE